MSWWDGLFGRRDSKLSMTRGVIVEGSKAGKLVTPSSVMQLSAAWACVRLLAETVGTLPCEVFTVDPNGSTTAAPANPLWTILHDSPFNEMSAAEFWEAMVAGICLWGNSYAAKMTGTRGQLVGLEYLRPDLMNCFRDQFGVRRYIYSDPYKGKREFDDTTIFHIRGFGVGGTTGLSPISYARETMGAAMAADESAAKIFANGLQQPLFIDSGQMRLTPEQRADLRALFQEFTGSDNAGKVMVLEQGMKPVPLSFNPEDAQLLQTRQFNVEEICRWFRVPPFMVGHTEKSTSWGTGLEQQMIGFANFSLRPYLHRIESAITKQLLQPQDRQRIKACFDLDELLRGDSAARAALYTAFSQNGVMDRDEIRRKEHLRPRGGGAAVLTVQAQIIPLDDIGKQPPPPGGQPPTSSLQST